MGSPVFNYKFDKIYAFLIKILIDKIRGPFVQGGTLAREEERRILLIQFLSQYEILNMERACGARNGLDG